jgi:hypothetical protein
MPFLIVFEAKVAGNSIDGRCLDQSRSLHFGVAAFKGGAVVAVVFQPPVQVVEGGVIEGDGGHGFRF